MAATDVHMRWIVLGAGVVSQAAMSSLHHGLPAIGPVLRSSLGLSLTEAALVLGAANIGTMSMLILCGMVTDRFGERAATAIGLIGAGGFMTLAAATTTPANVGFLLFLAGGLSAVTISASGRSVMGWFPQNERGLALGIRQMSVTLGGALAALLLPLAAFRWGISGALYSLAGAFFFGAAIAFAGLRPPPRLRAEPRMAGLPPPSRDWQMWRLSFCSGLYACAQIAVAAFLAIFLHEYRGYSLTAAAGAFAAVQVGGGIARIIAGKISDRSGYRIPQMRLHGLLLSLFLLLSSAFVDAANLIVLTTVIVAGVLTLSWNGLAFTATAEMAGYSKAGFALGLQGTVMRLVSAGAGVAFGAIVSQSSWGVGFALLAVFPLLGSLLLGSVAVEERRRGGRARMASSETP